jgi:hypothetical protein
MMSECIINEGIIGLLMCHGVYSSLTASIGPKPGGVILSLAPLQGREARCIIQWQAVAAARCVSACSMCSGRRPAPVGHVPTAAGQLQLQWPGACAVGCEQHPA